MLRCQALSYSAAFERFTIGAFASNFARCVEKNVRTLRMFDELAKSRLGNSLQAAMSARSALENSSTLISSLKSRSYPKPSKYLNSVIEQDHRHIKYRTNVMLGFKRFRSAATTIAGIELTHRIRKGQFDLAELGLKEATARAV